VKKFFARNRLQIKNSVLGVVSCAALLLVTQLTLGLGSIATTVTVALLFLTVITLSSFFGSLVVSVVVSLAAALLFDYYYLPPFGTLDVGSLPDWISLTVFLLIAVIISKLTASTAATREVNARLTSAMANLTELGRWLIAVPNDELTLAAIAEETARLFKFSYCSIHVYSFGKWDHAYGSARSVLSDQVEEGVQKIDLPLDWTVMVTESELGARYVQIKNRKEAYAILVVKDDDATTETLKTLGYLIGVKLATT